MISFIALSGLFRFYFFFSIPFFTPFLFIAVVLMQANMLSSRNGELTQKPNKQKEPKKSLWLIYLPFSICQSTKSDFVHASTKSIYIHKHTHTHTVCAREKCSVFGKCDLYKVHTTLNMANKHKEQNELQKRYAVSIISSISVLAFFCC